MRTESARMTSAAEARFRMDRPNSQPRAITVIALDPPSERVVSLLADGAWNQAAFVAFRTLSPEELHHRIGSADLVVLVATAGENARGAAVIGHACNAARVSITGLILGEATSSDEALSQTLAALRPWTLMLVSARSTEYVEDMLRAMRA